MQRRKLLAVLSSVGTLAIAGCSSGESSNDETNETLTETGDPSASSDETGRPTENSDTDGDDNSEGQTQQSLLGTAVWSQRSANTAGTEAVNARGVSLENPSSYTIPYATGYSLDFYPHYDPVFTENAMVYRGAIRNKVTGETIRQLPATETATPALSDGRLFMIAGAEVIAVDVENDEELWRQTTGQNGTAIVAAGDRVFVNSGAGITAYSAADGSQVWSTDMFVRLLDDGGRIFAGANEQLYAGERSVRVYNGSDGTQLWEKGGLDSPQLGPQGALYALDFETLKKFDSDGSTVWKREYQSSSLSPVAVDATNVYIRDDPSLTALSPDDGSNRWTTELPQDARDVAVSADRVYVYGDSQLLALDKRSGEQNGSYTIQGNNSHPRGYGGVSVGGGVVSVARSGGVNTKNTLEVLTTN